MTTKEKESFYASLAHRLTVARQRCNISIAQLALRSGEQYKTIQDIESGKVKCSLHHAVWMKSILGLDIFTVIEGKNEQRIDDLI